MANNFVADLLREEKEKLRRKEHAAKAFASKLEDLRKSAAAYRVMAADLEKAFTEDQKNLSQKSLADQWGLTATERGIAFDKKPVILAPQSVPAKKTTDETTETDDNTAQQSDETANPADNEAGDDEAGDGGEANANADPESQENGSDTGEQSQPPVERPAWMNNNY